MHAISRRAALAAALLIGLAGAAAAHDPKPRHGGRIVHAGSFHIELVADGTRLDAFLVGHDDKPMSAEGYQGVAILVLDGKSQRITLAPAANNQLTGTAPASVPGNAKAVVQITTPTGGTAQARFN